MLYTVKLLGIARGGAGNALFGNQRHTHVNLGAACTTGGSGYTCSYATVGGGYRNSASHEGATVGGGNRNTAGLDHATVGGGWENIAEGNLATVGGGQWNAASATCATVGGGDHNWADAVYGTVGGGQGNTAKGLSATTVGGGVNNTATEDYATVGGGDVNTASGYGATVSGGERNVASGHHAAIPGGYRNTASDDCAFATGNQSRADSLNSAAFNGQTTTTPNQTRVGILSKASGTFTIDHPLDPHGKILNHYFIEGPEMLNIYRGSVMLDASGRAEVSLPDYFDALNRNPMVQLTGVGTAEVVYLAEKATGNRFAVGGPAGAKVYWQVTGERKDVSAEVTRRMMPVEQPKTENLAGTMLDDEFLSGCMDQLERTGNAQGIEFRTAGGRQRYERMKQLLEENRRTR